MTDFFLLLLIAVFMPLILIAIVTFDGPGE